MRIIPGVIVLVLLASPAVARSQSFELYGSAGPTLTDKGNSLAAGVGFSPASRVTFVFSFERTHLSSQTRRDRDVVSSFRGGTLFLGTAELRFAPFRRGRLGPFAVAGVAAGMSRPNVNDVFPDRVTNSVRGMFLGGGIDVPLSPRTSVFADARMYFGAEGNEGILAVAPLRAGIVWRF